MVLLFSVVIPVFNRPASLAACLVSVAAQRYRNFEVIVIDDASTEDIAAVVAASGLPVRLQRQAMNAGPGAARNTGLGLANASYVAFLDSDDTWFPWTLETYKEAIHQTGAPSFLAGRQAQYPETLSDGGGPAQWRRYRDYLSTAPRNVWIAGCAVAIRRTVLQQAGGFSTQRANAEDSDLWLRLGEAPGFVEITSPPTFRYHRSSNSLITMHDLTRTGILQLAQREQDGKYPGGKVRERERRRIIGRHVRPPVIDALNARSFGFAWRLYRQVFLWQLIEARWKFLIGFWFVLLRNWLLSQAEK